MLEEMRESVPSLTLGEVSMGEKPVHKGRTAGAQGEGAFQTLGPPAGAGELVIPGLAHADFPKSMLGVLGRGRQLPLGPQSRYRERGLVKSTAPLLH